MVFLLLLGISSWNSPASLAAQSVAIDDVKRDTPDKVIHPGQSVHIDVDLALVNVTVTDPYDRVVTGLEPDNFRVFEPAGLLTVAGIVLADITPERVRRNVEDRNIHQYKFHHSYRTILTLLGIISEIEIHCTLNNKEQTVKVWERLAEYHADTKDIYEARYKATLAG